MNETILRVAINAPLSRLFDYLPPEHVGLLPNALQPGTRVLVPFGRQKQTGIIIECGESSEVPIHKLRRAISIIDEAPLLGEADLWLLGFASNYYQHPIGEVAAAALPKPLRQGQSLNPVIQQLSITEVGRTVEIDALGRRAPKQAEFLEALHSPLRFDELDAVLPGWRRLKKAMLDKGWIRVIDIEDAPPISVQGDTQPSLTLNSDQMKAVTAIRDRSGFHVSLLDGVTGSGKTEVYLHLMQDHLDAGRQILILVPEIGLTPQLLSRLSRRLGKDPVVLHSSLSDGARLAAWRDVRSGAADVVIGTRSAVFVPMKNPGLIIVDEEHDNSLKQQEGFRYSARDLAIARGMHSQVPVVLGTATPSLETLKRCNDGAYLHLRLPARAGASAPPLMRLIDLTIYPSNDGISEPAANAIRKNLDAGGQALIFLNRRGFAPTLICGGCGKIAECGRCDARMTVHAADNELRCHHCGAFRPIDADCSDCGGSYLPLGHGTERLEESLRARFPREAIARVDSDSTRLKGTMDRALSLATTGETKILIGTQMLSKGHHFPKLTLVVVVNADQGLFSTDFRGAEKLAQTLVQVSGRAGREKRQGEVLIQTAFPAHPFWGELFRGGYDMVAASALEERERAAWPPFTRLALVRSSAHKRDDAFVFLESARRWLDANNDGDVRILGPVSAPMERRAGRYRAQLLIQSANRQALQQLLQRLRQQLESDSNARKVRWSMDVDPIELF